MQNVYDGGWYQISGDVSASDVSAKFAQVENDSITIVNVEYQPELSSALPYYVTQYEFDTHEFVYRMRDGSLARAVESMGMGDDFQWHGILACEAMFDYGVCDERQPSTYFDEYGAQFPTLRSVMDDYGIPASALWMPSEYDAPAPELD